MQDQTEKKYTDEELAAAYCLLPISLRFLNSILL
jgi:hypothetical protein